MKRLLFFILLLVGCGTNQTASTLNGLGASGSGKNVAVFVGAPNGLSGVATDIEKMDQLFSKPDFRFEVFTDNNASTSEIFALVKEKAKDADSFMFYFSGHGNRGVMLADDRTFTFREVVEAIKEVRSTPFARLIVVIDSCLSGSFVDDPNHAIITEPDAETGSHQLRMASQAVFEPLNADQSLYKQAFVFSAAKRNENSLDLGRSRGGSFTYTFRTMIEKYMVEKPLITFRELAQTISNETDDKYGHTPMWRGFPSADVMDDYFFLYRMPE